MFKLRYDSAAAVHRAAIAHFRTQPNDQCVTWKMLTAILRASNFTDDCLVHLLRAAPDVARGFDVKNDTWPRDAAIAILERALHFAEEDARPSYEKLSDRSKAAIVDLDSQGRRFVHKASGDHYVVLDVAFIERDLSLSYVYHKQSDLGGVLFVRPVPEFLEKFDRLPKEPTSDKSKKG